MSLTAELLVDCKALLGEAPAWLARERVLLWVDVDGHSIHRLEMDTGLREVRNLGQPVGAIVERARGGMAVAIRDGFAILESWNGPLLPIAPTLADNPEGRMNDGKCDPRGRFWAGSMAMDCSPGGGKLY